MPNSRSELDYGELFAQLARAFELGRQAVNRWGEEGQLMASVEEAGEFVRAVARHRTDRGDWRDVVDEAADVIITALQVAHMGGREGTLRLAASLRGGLHKLEAHLAEAGEP
jgi:NTP pyrophosphatase (non-canonical NTP hydrolase)